MTSFRNPCVNIYIKYGVLYLLMKECVWCIGVVTFTAGTNMKIVCTINILNCPYTFDVIAELQSLHTLKAFSKETKRG